MPIVEVADCNDCPFSVFHTDGALDGLGECGLVATLGGGSCAYALRVNGDGSYDLSCIPDWCPLRRDEYTVTMTLE